MKASEIPRGISRVLGYLFILPIKAYQRFISPMFPARCKYYPSCSAYAAEAYKKHGVFFGTLLSAWRLLRCNPWSMGGIDYVPDRLTAAYFVPKNLRKDNAEEDAPQYKDK